jgi:glycogen debranching enzyme
MLNAVEYLSTRDMDNDGLLEQNHNEDWMDTAIRAGKIVHSQACWILALSNLSSLLSHLGRIGESNKFTRLAD